MIKRSMKYIGWSQFEMFGGKWREKIRFEISKKTKQVFKSMSKTDRNSRKTSTKSGHEVKLYVNFSLKLKV